MVSNNKKKNLFKKLFKRTVVTSSGDAVIENISAIDVAAGIASATKKDGGSVETTETLTMTSAISCTHGSTAKNLADGSHYHKIIDKWMSILKNTTNPPTENDILMMAKFWTKYNYLEKDTEFIKFVFAFVTNMYLMYDGGSGSFDQSSSMKMVQHVLGFGLSLKYDFVDREKYMKYTRDIHKERGIINCLSRETSSESCHCMESLKSEAETMENVGMCYGCYQKFSKTLNCCSRCHFAQYCGEKCMKKDWSYHTEFCTPYIKSEE